MSGLDENKDKLETSVRSCYSTWGPRYYEDYYRSSDAYPPVHTEIVRDLLQTSGVSNVIDAGCGPASMLRDLIDLNLDLYGFDLTPEMVVEAKRVLSMRGQSSENIWLGSVLDEAAFSGGPKSGEKYDAGICFGVLPHVPKSADRTVLENFANVVRPGGLVAIEARNELFSLFTLNRYSQDFFQERLIRSEYFKDCSDQEKSVLKQVSSDLSGHFRMDLPPLRKGYEDEPGYDEVLSRTHNPFELKSLAEEVGLVDVDVLFYHYHALPPMMEQMVPDLFRRESLAMENPKDWRGYFMASAFILVGQVPKQDYVPRNP